MIKSALFTGWKEINKKTNININSTVRKKMIEMAPKFICSQAKRIVYPKIKCLMCNDVINSGCVQKFPV